MELAIITTCQNHFVETTANTDSLILDVASETDFVSKLQTMAMILKVN